MANRNMISTIFYSTLLLAFLLIISNVECRTTPYETTGAVATATLSCTQVYGAQLGDTCSGVGANFGLITESFLSINPNINCAKIFVGQWLCLSGQFTS